MHRPCWGVLFKKEWGLVGRFQQHPRARAYGKEKPNGCSTDAWRALNEPRKFRNLLESLTGNHLTEEVQEPSRRWEVNSFVCPSPQSSASIGPRFFPTHSHPAIAVYTKLKLLTHYRDKDLFFGGKTVIEFKSEEDARTQLPCDRAEIPTSLDSFWATSKELSDNPHHRRQVSGTQYQVGRRPAVEEQYSSL